EDSGADGGARARTERTQRRGTDRSGSPARSRVAEARAQGVRTPALAHDARAAAAPADRSAGRSRPQAGGGDGEALTIAPLFPSGRFPTAGPMFVRGGAFASPPGPSRLPGLLSLSDRPCRLARGRLRRRHARLAALPGGAQL